MNDTATPRTRVSQRPGSIPCTLQDLQNPETVARLRAVLKVEPFVRELRQLALQTQSIKGDSSWPISTCK